MKTVSSKSAFTVIELAIVAGLLGIILGGLGLMFGSSRKAYQNGSAVMQIESRGLRAMNRITKALRAANRATIAPAANPPLSTAQIDYQISDGPQVGGVAWSTPRRIQLLPGQGQVASIENPGLANQTTTVLCSGVPPLLQGEVANNVDDNGNGLVDEPGLCFSMNGRVLTVSLTIQGTGSDNANIQRTFQTQVFCRN